MGEEGKEVQIHRLLPKNWEMLLRNVNKTPQKYGRISSNFVKRDTYIYKCQQNSEMGGFVLQFCQKIEIDRYIYI